MARRLLLPLVFLLSGCASVSPRFSPEIAAAFARDEMRKLETDHVELYYPSKEHDAAVLMLERMEFCLSRLRRLPRAQRPRSKALVYLTTSEFNNAYVYPSVLGLEQHMVVPHHFTSEFFNWFELGLTEPGDVACHEAVHYVQMQQIDGFWEAINSAGGNIFPPNAMIDTWFLEGLATYYEGRLGSHAGRTHNPIWTGSFLSGIASQGGQVRAGDLSSLNRNQLPFGGNYLVGMQFVDFLARKYGEDKLWELIDVQGNSIFSPLWVTLRFKAVYGLTLGALLDQYNEELAPRLKERARPAEQHMLANNMGYAARIASSRADGAIATLTASLDEPVRLTVREADGRVRFSKSFTQLFPERTYIYSSPLNGSGFAFSHDGKSIFILMLDVDTDGEDTARLLQFEARDGALLRHWDVGAALGGSISPDGSSYVFVQVQAERSNLVRLNLQTGQREPLTEPEHASLGAPDCSPDGKRIVFARRVGGSFDLFLRDENGQVSALTQGEQFDYFPHWIDDGHVLFLRDADGRMQVHTLDVQTRAVQQVTRAPFIALDPVPWKDGTVLFLNREGWGWTLDSAPLAAQTVSATAVPLASGPTGATFTSTAPDAQSTRRLHVERDDPYSPFDHLFVPSLHVPYLLPSVTIEPADPADPGGLSRINFGSTVGLSLQGSDRLGYHAWAANVSYTTGHHGPSFDLSYGNNQLAPWWITATAGRAVSGSRGDTVDFVGALQASRSFWTTPFALAIEGLQRTLGESAGTFAGSTIRLIGPSLAFDYFAGESRPYGGYHRGIGFGASATIYPEQLGSRDIAPDGSVAPLTLGDGRVDVRAYVPLPLKYHSLFVHAAGRGLPGAPPELLQVGGIQNGARFLTYPEVTAPPGPSYFLPGGLSFSEYVRGYEDFPVYATYAATAGARYRYPFIIDRGFTSFLYLLPALFLRQVDVELFAEGAYTNTSSPWHRAAGASIAFRSALSLLPLTFYVQGARRFDDGLGYSVFFGFVAE